MQEFKNNFNSWDQEDKIIIARVISTWGSSPRPIGSALIIDSALNMYGSVSGGCIEGAVVKEAKNLFETGGSKILEYGVSDQDAWSVGLSCGGKIEVFIQLFEKSELRTLLFSNIAENKSCIWLTKIENANLVKQCVLDDSGFSMGTKIPFELQTKIQSIFNARKSTIIEHEEARYFAHILPRKSQMLIIGAAHISSDLIHLAKFYNFETIVIDPRADFANRIKFIDQPDQIIIAYPSEVLENFKLDQYTFVVILSHDPKIDDNALHILLKKKIAYLGALGSKKTHAKRIERLAEAGFSTEEIDQISAPIGLDINANSPREIALSIIGEVIQVKNR